MATLTTLIGLGAAVVASAAAPVVTDISPSVVYLEVEDANGGVVDRGTGFIVSEDGYVVTAAHLKPAPDQQLVGVIGQRQGVRYTLNLRDANYRQDVALWQLPQSLECRRPVTLGTEQVAVQDAIVIAGFPNNDGLTFSSAKIANLTSDLGFYKADGYLQPGNSGGPVIDSKGNVIAIVEGGALPGTANNDLVPIATALDLIHRLGVQASVDTTLPPSDRCYASCRVASNGIESWTTEEPWGPVDSGWLPGGHGRQSECNKLIAAALVARPNAQIELLPDDQGMWEISDKDFFGTTKYKYFCRGILRTGPIYIKRQSRDCGLRSFGPSPP